MADKVNAPVTSGFFSTPSKTSSRPLFDLAKETTALNFVAVGSPSNSAFKGAAVSMIANVLSLKTRAHQELAKRLLDLHAKYFEQALVSVRLITSIQLLEKLLESPYARVKFILELAYALRQETVTEILQDLERYLLACFIEGETLTPEKMRETGVQLDKSAMSALSKIMQVPCELHEEEPNKGLRKRTVNGEPQQEEFSPIILQLQEGIYFSLVRDAEYFALVNKCEIELNPKPHSFKDPELTDFQKKIKDKEQYLLQKFDKEVLRLNKMLQAGELTKARLLSIYIENIPCADQRREIKYAGIEFGSQQWFKRLKAVHNGVAPVNLSDKQEENELVEALARGICTGEIDAALVYEAEEKQKSPLAFTR